MKKREKYMLSEYEIDNIWMSYRYCIGRHTIAAHCHAGDIANNAYGHMTKERMQFMAKDINQEIYDSLHVHDWFLIDNVWNMKNFKPLDIFYQCLNDLNLKDVNDLKRVKGIECYYTKEGELKTDVYYYNDKDKFNYKSLMDISDLEVWQRLANLFDIDGHKWCRLVDDSIVEYYEYWRKKYTEDGSLRFEKIKTPIESYHNFAVCKFIPKESIKEDNIKVN